MGVGGKDWDSLHGSRFLFSSDVKYYQKSKAQLVLTHTDSVYRKTNLKQIKQPKIDILKTAP